MYEILKAIANLNEWAFMYARKDFQNLFNESEKKGIPYIFLDPVQKEKIKNDSGVTESIKYSGSFMLVLSSDIDEEDYDYRYQNFIKPITGAAIDTIDEVLICDYKAGIESWKEIEVINALDYNFDGVIVDYSIIINEV